MEKLYLKEQKTKQTSKRILQVSKTSLEIWPQKMAISLKEWDYWGLLEPLDEDPCSESESGV